MILCMRPGSCLSTNGLQVRATIQRAVGRPVPLEQIGTMTVGGLKELAADSSSGAAPKKPAKAAESRSDSIKGPATPDQLPSSPRRSVDTPEQPGTPKASSLATPSDAAPAQGAVQTAHAEQVVQVDAVEVLEAAVPLVERADREQRIWALMTAISIFAVGVASPADGTCLILVSHLTPKYRIYPK